MSNLLMGILRLILNEPQSAEAKQWREQGENRDSRSLACSCWPWTPCGAGQPKERNSPRGHFHKGLTNEDA